MLESLALYIVHCSTKHVFLEFLMLCKVVENCNEKNVKQSHFVQCGQFMGDMFDYVERVGG